MELRHGHIVLCAEQPLAEYLTGAQSSQPEILLVLQSQRIRSRMEQHQDPVFVDGFQDKIPQNHAGAACKGKGGKNVPQLQPHGKQHDGKDDNENGCRAIIPL